MPAECRAQPSQEQWAGARDGAKLRHFPYFQHEKNTMKFFLSVAISSITRFSPALLALLLSSEEKSCLFFQQSLAVRHVLSLTP